MVDLNGELCTSLVPQFALVFPLAQQRGAQRAPCGSLIECFQLFITLCVIPAGTGGAGLLPLPLGNGPALGAVPAPC